MTGVAINTNNPISVKNNGNEDQICEKITKIVHTDNVNSNDLNFRRLSKFNYDIFFHIILCNIKAQHICVELHSPIFKIRQ